MAKNDRTTAGPYWTRNWIEKMWRFTAENFVDFDTGTVDFEALGREEYEFRKALFFRKFKNSERAREAFVESEEGYKTNVENGKKGGRPRKETTADGDIREDSQAKPDGSATTKNETRTHDALGPSANHYGDAATREGADESTTVSGQFRGSAKNQGESNTGSTVPAVCPESGDISKARQSQARESQRRTDGHSLRVGNVARPPVRSRASFRNKEDFIQWAIDTGLDTDDAGNCWEATMERGGLTKDGKKVENLCAYAVKWCRTSKKNRETA